MKESGARPLSWVFYTLILPILFTVIIVFLIVQFMLGINLTGDVSTWAVQVPVIRHALGLAPIQPPVAKQVQDLRTELAVQMEKVAGLQEQLSSLEEKLASSQSSQSGDAHRLDAVQSQLRKLEASMHSAAAAAAIYTNMAPGQAAQIILQLPFGQEVLTMKAMDSGTQAQILSQMPVAKAARLLQAGG